MVLFLFVLTVICMLSEGCRKPQCTLKNSAGENCYVRRKDINMDNNRFFAKFRNMTTTLPNISRARKIRFNIGMKRKLGIITLTIHHSTLPWKYIAKIYNKKIKKQKSMTVALSCLRFPRQTISVTVRLLFKKVISKRLENSWQINRGNRRYLKTSNKENDLMFTMDIDARRPLTKTMIRVGQPVKNRRIQRNKTKRDTRFNSPQTENCVVDLSAKTMTFWMKKPNKRIVVEKCGVLNNDYEMISGRINESAKIVSCVTPYSKPDNYYSRIFFYDQAERLVARTCYFHKEALESKSVSKIIGSSSFESNSIELSSDRTTPNSIGISTNILDHIKANSFGVKKHQLSSNSLSPFTTDYVKLQRDQEENSVESTQAVVVVILFSALIPLSVFVIVLYCNGRELQHDIKVKTDQYSKSNESAKESSEPKAMIVTLDEFDECHNKDVIQLGSLLSSEKINVVTLESYADNNVTSRYGSIEQLVQENNHFIFVVSKEMSKTLKILNEDWSMEIFDEVESISSMEDKVGTCAYIIALIRNKFVKSIKFSGHCENICHMLRFEETELEGIPHVHQGWKLFPSIEINHYSLYSNKRFQFHQARRIINNIKNRKKKTFKQDFVPTC